MLPKQLIRILCIIFLFFAGAARSQVIISLIFGEKLNSPRVEFGLDGGLNVSSIQGLSGANYKRSFNLGFYFDFKFKNPSWMFNTGVIVISPLGAQGLPVYSLNNNNLDSAFYEGSVTRNLNYFDVPFNLKYKFKNNFFVKAGITLALISKCYDEFYKTIQSKDDLHYSIKIKDQYNPIDGGFSGGIGYRLLGGNGMNLGINYYLGLIPILKDKNSPKQYNRSVYFNVGIPIGAAKKKDKNGTKGE